MSTLESAPEKPAETPADDLAPAPRTVDWDNPRVAAILAAAAKCFARKGFSATTLAEIGKELGLRKSIVHYYFASKAALIHEVQSYTYHKYLDRVKEALRSASGESSTARSTTALQALWESIHGNKTGMGMNIEVWSASRRDAELKRRALALHRDARSLIREGVADVLGVKPDDFPQIDAMATLIQAVVNGLSVTEYLEGEDAKARDAYNTFLYLLRLGIKAMPNAPTSSR
jgi:AcrR family transcriptional regulator